MIKNFIKEKILGYSLPQEYACLALETMVDPLSVSLTMKGNKTFLDVSESHLFLGYKPLIIGIPLRKDSANYRDVMNQDEICLSFNENGFEPTIEWREFPSSNETVARVVLKKNHMIECGENTLFLFEGVYARHKFISDFSQFINRQKEKRRSDRKANINLLENLADQVQTAYSIPRIISIITLSEHNKMNMFPTDLHGRVGNEFYIGSLRHGGKANEQVEKLKRIVLSRVDVSWYKQAYALGKNHMQDLKDLSFFLLSNIRSASFGIPLPEAMVSYCELEQTHAVDIGIHRVHSYRIVNELKATTSETLSHIHRFYAQWRINNSKHTKLYWR
jgi:hypothetical protein